MKQYLIAAALLTAFATHAAAQAPPPGVVLPAPTPMVVPPSPFAAPVGAPNGFYVSGGQLVGGNGSYPFDSGMYLLGGTDTARVTGHFRMVYPGTPGGPPAPTGSSYGSGRSSCPCRW